jgi:hypothetical protein
MRLSFTSCQAPIDGWLLFVEINHPSPAPLSSRCHPRLVVNSGSHAFATPVNANANANANG